MGSRSRQASRGSIHPDASGARQPAGVLIMMRIDNAPATLLSSRAKAQAIVDRLSDDDITWSYRVEQRGAWFAIVVTDEDGLVLGDL
jgi:hypothetical protein